jgi:hypothetical protein
MALNINSCQCVDNEKFYMNILPDWCRLGLIPTMLMFAACSSNSERNDGFVPLKLIPIYYTPTDSVAGKAAWVHYILLDNYSEKYIPVYSFIDITFQYLDTVSAHKPIHSVVLCSKDFTRNGDPEDIGARREASVVDFGFDLDSNDIDKKFSPISSMVVWRNSVPMMFNLSVLQRWYDKNERK